MYPTRTYMNELLNRMDHVFERMRILSRTRSSGRKRSRK